MVQGPPVEDGFEVAERRVIEAEIRDGLERSLDAGDHTVPAPARQPSGEHLEGADPIGGPVGQCRLQHRQFVLIGEQAGRLGHRHTWKPIQPHETLDR